MDAEISFHPEFGERGLWWPDYDPHPQRNYDYTTRNVKDLDFTISLCRKRGLCIQAGGHAGIWPLKLAQRFDTVLAFEPDPELFRCLVRNAAAQSNIGCRREGLSQHCGMALYERGLHAGSGRIDFGVACKDGVPLTSIDSLGLSGLDCLVLDIEAHEPLALRGAAETIARCAPVIHCEELPEAKDEIHSILKDFGYRLVKNIHKDGIWTPQ